MKILITGCNGLLGNDLWSLLNEKHEVYGADVTECGGNLDKSRVTTIDITDQKQTYDKISKINPEVIIHLAVYSDVDACEKNHVLAYKINSLGTRNVCLACQRFDATLCYISTDYVFDGENTPDEGYSEFDDPNPLSVYAKTKYYGENYVKQLLNKFFIVRTAWLFGGGRGNFISYVSRSVKQQEEIKVVADQKGSMTYTKDLSEALGILIEKKSYGTYHLTNSKPASREEVVEYIFKILGRKTRTKSVTRSQIFTAKRPKNSALNNMVWNLDGLRPLRGWQESVYDFLRSEI